MRGRFGLGRFVLLFVMVALDTKLVKKLKATPGRKRVENWRSGNGRILKAAREKNGERKMVENLDSLKQNGNNCQAVWDGNKVYIYLFKVTILQFVCLITVLK